MTVAGGALARHRLRAARRERPGEVGGPARRALRRRRDDRRRAGRHARPHRADARGSRRRASRVRPTSVTVRPAERLSLGEVEVPGDFSSAAPFVVAATLVPGSELHVHGVNLNPTAHRAARRSSSGWARTSRSTTAAAIGGEPGGDLEIHAAPLVGDDRRRDEVPLRDRRAAALRARGGVRARRERRCAAPRSSARRRRTGSRRRSTRSGRSARAPARRRTASRSPASRRGCAAAASTSRGDHRIAMLGAVAGLASREGVRIEGADAVPSASRLLRDARGAPPRPRDVSEQLGDRDRGDRRPGRGGEELRRPGARRRGSGSTTSTRARCTAPSPGSRCTRAFRSTTAPGSRRSRRRIRSSSASAVSVAIAGQDVTRRIREPRDRRRRPGRRSPPGGARGDARAPARARPAGDSVIEGRDIGVVVVPEAEVKVWLVADPEVRARRRVAERDGLGDRAARRRSCGGETSATRPTPISRRRRGRGRHDGAAPRRGGRPDRGARAGGGCMNLTDVTWARRAARRSASAARLSTPPARLREATACRAREGRGRLEPLLLARPGRARRGEPAHPLLHGEGRGAPRARARGVHPRLWHASRCAAASRTARRCGRCGGSSTDGHALGLFVEGTRQRSGVPGDVQPGAAMVALQENVPIVPVAIYGTQEWRAGNFRPSRSPGASR